MVPSFEIDHTTLQPGLNLRETRKLNLFTKLKIWDLRFVAPSSKSALSSKVMHTIEHIFAQKLRILLPSFYVGFYPMGCKTGFYFVSTQYLDEVELRDALITLINHTIPIISKSEIPGLNEKQCGNPTLFSISATNNALFDYLKILTQ